jgi:hypothetical protein
MPTTTPRLGIKKPLGNENVTRQSFNDNWDIIDAAAAKKTDLDTTNTTVSNHETRIQAVEAQVGTPTPMQTTVQRGLSVITAQKRTPFNVLNITGRTLINLTGRNGNCEDASKFTDYQVTHALDSTNKVYGSNGLKVTLAAGTSGSATTSTAVTLDASKYYIVLADVKNGNASWVSISVANNYATTESNRVTDTTKFNLAYKKITGITTTNGININVGGAVGQYVYADGIRLYEITAAEYAAIDSMTPEQIAAKYPYVDDIKPIRNPYAIKYGRNLLPPFTEWGTLSGVVNSAYSSTITTTTTTTLNNICEVPAIPGQTYTFSVTRTGTGQIGLDFRDANANIIYSTGLVDASTLTVTAPTGAKTIRVFLSSNGQIGTFTFTNPMLNLGSTALPFEAQNNDYLFYDVKLHSSIDGTIYDSLFYNGNGQPRKLKRIDEVTVDGSFNVSFGADYTGFKTVSIPLPSTSLSTGSGVKIAGIKFDGKVLSMDQTTTQSDSWGLLNVTTASISIPDTDSGWTESMSASSSPEAFGNGKPWFEAFFNGWKCCNPGGGTWDGTTANLRWKSIFDGTGETNDQNLVKTTKAPGWTPEKQYRLIYQLANSVEEAVTVEGAIELHEGANVIEYGEGVVIREAANPQVSGGNYFINAGTSLPASKLANRVSRFLGFYKNGKLDVSWSPGTESNYGMQAGMTGDKYEPTAAYSVTYLVLDKYAFTAPATDLSAQYDANVIAVLSDTVQKQADIETRVSVVETQYARKQQGQWLAPTLLNGWVNYDGTRLTGYYKDEFGAVRFRGWIKNGVTTPGTKIFTLPKGYRPSQSLEIPIGSSDGTVLKTQGTLIIANNGDVVLSSTNYNTYLILDSITFRAEQ